MIQLFCSLYSIAIDPQPFAFVVPYNHNVVWGMFSLCGKINRQNDYSWQGWLQVCFAQKGISTNMESSHIIYGPSKSGSFAKLTIGN